MDEVDGVGDPRRTRQAGELGQRPGHCHRGEEAEEEPVEVRGRQVVALLRLLLEAARHQPAAAVEEKDRTDVAEDLRRVVQGQRREAAGVVIDGHQGGGAKGTEKAVEHRQMAVVPLALHRALLELGVGKDLLAGEDRRLHQATARAGPGALGGDRGPVAAHPHEPGDEAEEGHGDVDVLKGVDGEELRVDDLPLGNVQVALHREDREEEDHRNREQQRQEARAVEQAGEGAGPGEVGDRVVAHRRQKLAWLGTARAVGGAVAAVVADPHEGIGD